MEDFPLQGDETNDINKDGESMSMEQADNESYASWKNTSDPVLEEVIMGLTDRSRKFSTPFELSDYVEDMLRAQTRQAGARALSWTQCDFDRVGGKNTLRAIWENLKSETRIVGRKRKNCGCSEEEEGTDTERKRLCVSLDLSGTCSRLDDIKLDSSGSNTSGLRDDEESSSSLDVSRLLEETGDLREADRCIREAEELLMEIREEYPSLTSLSESYESNTDSGNSEEQWGGGHRASPRLATEPEKRSGIGGITRMTVMKK